MAGDDSEWQTVRRRRAPSGPLKKLKALPIPVVPLAFDALAVPDEGAALAREKRKKKRAASLANKRSAAAKEDEEQSDSDDGTPAAAAAARRQAAAPARRALSSLGLGALLARWWAQLLLSLVWLRTLLSFGGGGPKRGARRPPPKAAAPAATAAAVAAAAVATVAAAAPGSSTPAAAAKALPAAPAVKPSAAVAAAPAATRSQTAAKSPPATAKPSAAAAPAPAPPPALAAAPAAVPAAAKAAKVVVDCDADWQAGKLLLATVPAAHAGVVSCVAIAGDLALSGGYDGALKLWHWTAGGGRAEAPPRRVKNLTGHTGHLEAVCADGATMRAASSGRDSSLKVWDLDGGGQGAAAREVASYYVYESVKCMAADWGAHSALLGSRSGAVTCWNLETGRKTQTLKGHGDEVTALRQTGGSSVFSGSRDATVRVWDVREAPGTQVAVLHGARGRVCSLDVNGHLLYVGDTSSSLKVYDLRALPAGSASSSSSAPSYHVPNAPAFAGDACPTAGLCVDGKSRVLLSSGIAWWTPNTQALEEAAEDCRSPMAVLNISAAPASSARPTYLYTVRLGPGIVTCMDAQGDGRALLGFAGGGLASLRLLRGKGARAAREGEGAATGDAQLAQALDVGVEEFSDDEGDDEEDSEDSD